MGDYHCICCDKSFDKKHHYVRHCSSSMHKKKESEILCRAGDKNELLEIVQNQSEMLKKQAELLEKQGNTIMELQSTQKQLLSTQKQQQNTITSLCKQIDTKSAQTIVNGDGCTVNCPTINFVLNDYGVLSDKHVNYEKICKAPASAIEALAQTLYRSDKCLENQNIQMKDVARNKFSLFQNNEWVDSIDKNIPEDIRNKLWSLIKEWKYDNTDTVQNWSQFLQGKLDERIEHSEDKEQKKKDVNKIKTILKTPVKKSTK